MILADDRIFTIQDSNGWWNSLAIAMSLPQASGDRSDAPYTQSTTGGVYSLHRIAIAIGRAVDECVDGLRSIDWKAIDTLLANAAHLQSLEILCGEAEVEDEVFEELVEDIRLQMPTVASRIHSRPYEEGLDDSREWALDMFGEAWRNWFAESTRISAVRQ